MCKKKGGLRKEKGELGFLTLSELGKKKEDIGFLTQVTWGRRKGK